MSCFLSYTSSITGDCTNTNSGAFTINIDGTAPDYTIQWLSPSSGTTSLGAGVTAYTQTNLSAGTYTFNIIDSCIPANTVLPVNIYVSSGTCVSITNIINTVCNSNNGSITALTSNLYGQASFYLYNDITGFIIDNTVNNNTYTFNNLSSGTYYVIADDGGGCTGKSESVIVKNSSNLSFGLYKVDNAGCAVDSGKLMITGLTGTPPYTYLWSNGGIMDNITGLTDGTYTVTVTDSSNCSVSNTSVINTVPKVGLGAIYLTQPSCFTADGEVEIIITGGTPPFYYLGSNGVTNVTFDRTVTFTGLGPGGFTIQVTDAGLCNFSTSTNLLTPNGMSTINVGITNSQCNDFSGIIGPITVFGGTSPYTYILTNSFGNTKTDTIYQSNWLFDGLSADTYNLTITDNGGCTFTSAYTINNQVLFGLTVSTTGTTCNGNNGSVYVQITSGGTPPYIYEINGSIITTSLTSYTFNNLTSGNYTVSVTDTSLCKQSKLFTIGISNDVDFQLLGVDSQNNNGSISVYITNGQPPFTLYWSDNVGGQTGTTVTNLTPGSYSVRVVDNNGCSKNKSIIIEGYKNYSSTGYYNVCSSSRFDQPITILSGPKQILNEGYNQLILESGYTNCVLTAATFQALVYVGAFSASNFFYTSTGLLDYPSDELWYNTIQTLLESLPQVGNVSINPQTNTIVITTNCEESSLVNTDVIIKMRIDYDIECACPILTPTPTPTITLTPTQTPTQTPTPTPTSTPIPYLPLSVSGSTFISFRMSATTSSTFQIKWGDGGIDNYVGSGVTVSHTYSPAYTGPIGVFNYAGTNNITHIDTFSSGNTTNSVQFTTNQLNAFNGLLRFDCTTTNRISGDIDLLPNTLTFFRCLGSNITSGNIGNLPPLLTSYDNQGQNTTTGDISGLTAPLVTYTNVGLNTTFGDINNLPATLRFYDNRGNNTTTGDIGNLPNILERYLNWGNNTTSGNISGLTNSLTYYYNLGTNTTTGDISLLPTNLTTFFNDGDNTTFGNISGLTNNLITYGNLGQNTTTGDISLLPPLLTYYENIGNNTTFGDIGLLPPNVRYFSIQGNSNTLSYTSGRTWSDNMNFVFINPIDGSFDDFEVDGLLIDLTGVTTWVKFDGTVTTRIATSEDRTSASDGAVIILSGNISSNPTVPTGGKGVVVQTGGLL